MWKCYFCDKTFKTENGFKKHSCTGKDRWFLRHEKCIVIGFEAWKMWLNISHSSRSEENRKYKNFMSIQLYNAFISFGKYVLESKIENIEQFLEFVVKNKIKIDDWRKDSIHEQYIRQIGKSESIEDALIRQAKIMEEWASEKNEDWSDFFRKIETGKALHLIRMGQINPWILLLSETANDMIYNRFTEEQYEILNEFLDIARWKMRMERQPKVIKQVKEVLNSWKI